MCDKEGTANEGTTPQQTPTQTPQPGDGVKGSVPQRGEPERGDGGAPPADD